MKISKPGASYYTEFCTRNYSTWAATNADSLPVLTITKNGVDDGTSPSAWDSGIAVSGLAIGRYRVTGTVPSDYSVGDIIDIAAEIIVDSVTGVEKIDEFLVISSEIYNSFVNGTAASGGLALASFGGYAEVNVKYVNDEAVTLADVIDVNVTGLEGDAIQQESGYVKVSEGIGVGQLDLTAGRPGIDWNKVSNSDSSVNLSNTSISGVGTVDNIGESGEGLSGVPWNSDWDAEVQSEVNDGLLAYTGEIDANVIKWNNESVASGAIPAYEAGASGGLPVVDASGYVKSDVMSVEEDSTPIDGKSLAAALRYIAAICAGKISGAGTGIEVFKGLDGLTDRVTVNVDATGNRTGVTYD